MPLPSFWSADLSFAATDTQCAEVAPVPWPGHDGDDDNGDDGDDDQSN
jgi:hypothetical protein